MGTAMDKSKLTFAMYASPSFITCVQKASRKRDKHEELIRVAGIPKRIIIIPHHDSTCLQNTYFLKYSRQHCAHHTEVVLPD